MTKFPAVFTYRAAKNIGVSQDLNNLVGVCGLFECDTPTNGPGTGVWFIDVMSSGVDGKVVHKAIKKDAPDQEYNRSFTGSVWSAWVKKGGLKNVSAPDAETVSATLTAAALLGGLITVNQGGASTAALQLPLATDLETALLAADPGLAVGDSFEFSVMNISTVDAEDATITTNTGWTLVGSINIPAFSTSANASLNSSARFLARRTAANAYVLYRLS